MITSSDLAGIGTLIAVVAAIVIALAFGAGFLVGAML